MESESLKDAKALLKLAEQCNDQKMKLKALDDLSSAYFRMEKYEQAKEESKKWLSIADQQQHHAAIMLANRRIGECFAELGKFVESKKYIDAFERNAKLIDDRGQIQLAYHVQSWIRVQAGARVVDNDDMAKQLFEEAFAFGKKSLCELEENKDIIKKLTNEENGNWSKRQANTNQLLAEVCHHLDRRSEAEKYNYRAITYAERSKDYDLRYRCYLTALSFGGDGAVTESLANKLLATARKQNDKRRIFEAEALLAKEKFLTGNIVGAYKIFRRLLSDPKNRRLVDRENCEEFRSEIKEIQQTIIFAHKHLKRAEKLEYLEEEGQKWNKCYTLAEKLADDLAEICIYESALKFYEKMLFAAQKLNDMEKVETALNSVAVTAFDARKWQKSLNYYYKLIPIDIDRKGQNSENAASNILNVIKCFIELKKSLADIKAYIEDPVLSKFPRIELEARECLLVHMKDSKFCADDVQLVKEQVERLKEKLSLNRESGENVIEMATNEQGFSDRFEEMDGDAILAETMVEAKEEEMEQKITEERDKEINGYGETRLHEAAREGRLDLLRRLIRAGYDLNKGDNGGWTALSEAVSHENVECARLLLDSGAKVNCQSNSKGSLVGERHTGGAMTPLIEAAAMLHLDLIRLLLDYGASVTSENDDGWTALDAFRDAIHSHGEELTGSERTLTRRIIAEMEDRQRSQNFHIRPGLPPRKPSGKPGIFNRKQIGRSVVESPPSTSCGDTFTATAKTPPLTSNDDTNKEYLINNESSFEIASFSPIGRRKRPCADMDWIEIDSDTDNSRRKSGGQRRSSSDLIRTSTRSRELPSKRLSVIAQEEEELEHNEQLQMATRNHLYTNANDNTNRSPLRQSAEPIQQPFQIPNRNDMTSLTTTRIVKLEFENAGSPLTFRDPVQETVDKNETVCDLKNKMKKFLEGREGKSCCLLVKTVDGTELLDGCLLFSAVAPAQCLSEASILRIVVDQWLDLTAPCRYDQFAINDKTIIYTNWKSALNLLEETKRLDLSNMGFCGLPALSLLKALQFECGMVELILSGNNLRSNEMRQLAKVVRRQQSLERLELAVCAVGKSSLDPFVQQLSSDSSPLALKVIDLSSNPLFDSGAEALLPLLTICPNLQQINLSATKLTDDGIDKMADTLNGLENMSKVELKRNHVSQSAVSKIRHCCEIDLIHE